MSREKRIRVRKVLTEKLHSFRFICGCSQEVVGKI